MNAKILHIFLFVMSAIAYGQVSIDLITDKKEYSTKDLIELTVVLEINGSNWVQESPIKLPDFSKFYEKGTGSTKNSVLNTETNTVISQLVYQMILQPKHTGKHKIGSALVKINGKIYKTEPFDIIVSDKKTEKNTNKNLLSDLYLNIEIEDKEVYPYQPIIAVIKAHSSDFNHLRNIKKVNPPYQKNLQVKPIDLSPSEIQMNNKNQASQTLGVYMFLAKESGYIEISPATIEVNTGQNHKLEKLKSNTLAINVKKLPSESPLNFKNAIGNFNLTMSSPNNINKVEVNKPIDIVMELSGSGNISEKLLPTIKKSENYQVFAPKIKQNIKNTKSGAEGSIEAHYLVIPKNTGDIEIESQGFSFFNPNEEKYIDLGKKSLTFRVATADELKQGKTTFEKVNEYTSNVIDNVDIPLIDKNKTTKNKNQNKKISSALISDYALIAIAILSTLAGAFIFLKKKKNTQLECEIKDTQNENIEDIEAKIRNQQPEITLDIKNFDVLFENKNYAIYLEEAHQAFITLEKNTQQKFNTDFKKHLENTQGKQVAEDFDYLVQTVRTEKYAPIHTEEHMQRIHYMLKTISEYIS